MLIEHHCDLEKLDEIWHLMNAQHDYVANAYWGDWFSSDTGFSRGGQVWKTTKVISAESHSLGSLKIWADKQRRNGARSVKFYLTWPITEGRFAGKRDNAVIDISTQG